MTKLEMAEYLNTMIKNLLPIAENVSELRIHAGILLVIANTLADDFAKELDEKMKVLNDNP